MERMDDAYLHFKAQSFPQAAAHARAALLLVSRTRTQSGQYSNYHMHLLGSSGALKTLKPLG